MSERKTKERSGSATLGTKLRGFRDDKGWSLREVAARAGVNHGYLSLLERGEVAEPAPSMLHKLAEGYSLPFIVLMGWAGYIESDETNLTTNQVRALSYLGDDISDDELEAVRAVIEVIRNRGAMYAAEGSAFDAALDANDRAQIRQHVIALLRKADCLHQIPTPLDQVMQVSRLVMAGEIQLEPEERRILRRRFGDLVDSVMNRLQGAIHFRSNEIFIRPELHELKRRFVLAHEVGHSILPWQRDVNAYLDDAQRLSPDVRISYERQANQAAIDILAQGMSLVKELDDSKFSALLLSEASDRYQISLQAMFRYAVEETHQQAATVIRFRRQGYVGPPHVYCSTTFSSQFGLQGAGLPSELDQAIVAAARTGLPRTCPILDRNGAVTTINVDVLDTPYARLALLVPAKSERRRLASILRAG
jgi:transcriptional regulator with XRE-family HTH domain/Zn-dependent peptidase ImmA (M78 family)